MIKFCEWYLEKYKGPLIKALNIKQKEVREMINFDATPEEFELVNEIAKRATKENKCLDFLTVSMDIMAAHCNGCKLKLTELLHADNGNFFHDVFGITNNINKRTAKLENHFWPRFAA